MEEMIKMGSEIDSISRKRISNLLDEDSFVEIGSLISARSTNYNLQPLAEASDGVTTGYGQIGGELVFIYAQNPDILGGSLGEMSCRKIAQLYQKAAKLGAPIIAMLDSTGFRVQESIDGLEGFGEILASIADASGAIPLFCVIYGQCGGGLGLIPSMSDFVFLEEEKGRLFVNSPNAIGDNYIEKLDTSSAKFQEKYNGIIDFAGDSLAIYHKICKLIELLPHNVVDGNVIANCGDDLNRQCELTIDQCYDAHYCILQIADYNEFIPYKEMFSPSLITGFISLGGITTGILANSDNKVGDQEKKRERMSADDFSKGTDFVKYCDAYQIPLLTILHSEGFETSEHSERRLLHEAARFTQALHEATITKVNLIPKKIFGSIYSIMNSKSLSADFTLAWIGANIGAMPTEVAQKLLKDDKQTIDFSSEKAAQHGFVDCVIEPEATRIYLVSAFDMLYGKNETIAKKHSIK